MTFKSQKTPEEESLDVKYRHEQCKVFFPLRTVDWEVHRDLQGWSADIVGRGQAFKLERQVQTRI